MKQIELLLTENVDNLGIVGDVVKVRPGYARNFLLPRALATKPTPGAIKRLSTRRAEVEKELKRLRADREATFARMDKLEITIQRSSNDQGILYGGVSQHEIAEAIRAEGYAIDDRHVRIGEQIKRLDTYMIPVVLDADMRTEVKLWVVSDKPREQLEAEAVAEPVVEEAPKEKKPKKGKAEREAEKAAEAEAAANAEGKPKKGEKWDVNEKRQEAPAVPGEEKPKKKGKKAEKAE
jgi:large subunit ribosomal protein L9